VERLRSFLDAGRMTILNIAIAEREGPVTFFKSAKTEWGTLIPEWDEQNRSRGVPSASITVKGRTLDALVREHGAPYYMKIDIEGMDRSALASLASNEPRPKFVSVEAAFPRDARLRSIQEDVQVLSALGYDRFKLVPQHVVERQVPPKPAAEGTYVPFRFAAGSSGLFGEETPGTWLTADQLLRQFRRIMLGRAIDILVMKSKVFCLLYNHGFLLLTRGYPVLAWYDVHAKHSTAFDNPHPARTDEDSRVRRAVPSA
jgi:FkbM family methyltransferase